MLVAALAIVVGLIVLVVSAQHFVDGAAACARRFGMPPLLVGMVVVGFGTSAPEMAVSVLAAAQGNPGIALGNAYGSNICNIALILGLTALVRPITVPERALRVELPILFVITALAAEQAMDGTLGRPDGLILLALFAGLMTANIRNGLKNRSEAPDAESPENAVMPLSRALVKLVAGLVALVCSSRLLVWGAVAIARQFGVSDLIIGLTIVAIGTSLPELASSLAAAAKREDDLALGNILGSNLFNTLAVVGLAAGIRPIDVESAVLTRDIPIMALLTLALYLVGWAPRGQTGRIQRLEGGLLFALYLGYTLVLLRNVGAVPF